MRSRSGTIVTTSWRKESMRVRKVFGLGTRTVEKNYDV